MYKLISLISLFLFTSCETCLTSRCFSSDMPAIIQYIDSAKKNTPSNIEDYINKDYGANSGKAYIHAMKAVLCAGEAYKHAQEAVEEIDYIEKETERQDTIKNI